jgi:hypothetical protein
MILGVLRTISAPAERLRRSPPDAVDQGGSLGMKEVNE